MHGWMISWQLRNQGSLLQTNQQWVCWLPAWWYDDCNISKQQDDTGCIGCTLYDTKKRSGKQLSRGPCQADHGLAAPSCDAKRERADSKENLPGTFRFVPRKAAGCCYPVQAIRKHPPKPSSDNVSLIMTHGVFYVPFIPHTDDIFLCRVGIGGVIILHLIGLY